MRISDWSSDVCSSDLPVEDIAADFGVSPLVVQRRLKLANVSPRLMADYRAGGVTLEQLMALTITDDHAAQEAAFYGAPEWQRSPAKLRERLTEREIDATHALVRRSEERRVGKECVRTCRSLGSPEH